MNNYEHYLSALLMIKKMKKDGVINDEEYQKSESAIAEKYCIKKVSIIRANDLINSPFRAMYIRDEKEEKQDEERS